MVYNKFKTPFGDLYYLVGKKIIHEYKDEVEAKEMFKQLKDQFNEYKKHKSVIDEAIEEAVSRNNSKLSEDAALKSNGTIVINNEKPKSKEMKEDEEIKFE